MTGELEQVAALSGVPTEKLKDHLLRKQTDAAAMAESLPGPVRDAFEPMQSVKSGPYTVRYCCDGDIEYLSLLEHPLNEMRLRAQANPEAKIDDLTQATGQTAYDLCYLFTHSLDEIDDLWESGGKDAFQKASKKEFKKLTMMQLVALGTVCVQQYGRYWNPMLSYDAAESENGEVVKKNT